MNVLTSDSGWILLALGLLGVVILRRPLVWLGKTAVRSALGLGFLALWARSGIAAGLALGVNAFNGVILGLLGLPGLGLLFLFRWLG